jgi:uncharacterized membrane protein YagU involved in acid resistance
MTNHWKGFVLGAVGGAAGVLAMMAYWNAVTAIFGQDPRTIKKKSTQPQPLEEMSLIGQHHEEGESSTAAMGRIGWKLVTGKEPRAKETRTTLSWLVHWVISMASGAAYGVVRGKAEPIDVPGGLLLGTSLWLLGDELAMPLLGLTDGPTAYPTELHVHAFGAHVAYGLASSVTTQVLYRLL